MSILADSLGPSYPSSVPPSLQGGQDSTSTTAAAALSPQTDDRRRQRQARQRKDNQAPAEKKNRPTICRRETLMSDIPMDSSLDILSSLVDFELFEQSVQSLDEDISRNNQAPADFDANVLLSDYESLFGTQAATAPASSAFPSVF
jgi:hypothetical protein